MLTHAHHHLMQLDYRRAERVRAAVKAEPSLRRRMLAAVPTRLRPLALVAPAGLRGGPGAGSARDHAEEEAPAHGEPDQREPAELRRACSARGPGPPSASSGRLATARHRKTWTMKT